MFRAIISPILRSTRLCLQLVVYAPTMHYTTSCKHSLVLLKVGEIINKLLLLHLVGYLCYCIRDVRSHEHQISRSNTVT